MQRLQELHNIATLASAAESAESLAAILDVAGLQSYSEYLVVSSFLDCGARPAFMRGTYNPHQVCAAAAAQHFPEHAPICVQRSSQEYLTICAEYSAEPADLVEARAVASSAALRRAFGAAQLVLRYPIRDAERAVTFWALRYVRPSWIVAAADTAYMLVAVAITVSQFFGK